MVPTMLPTQATTVSVQPQFVDVLNSEETTSSLEQGRRYYQAGRFSAAVTLWQQAAHTYQTEGNSSSQALSLSYLASAYKELGQWDSAETAITQSLTLLQGADFDIDNAAQLSSNTALILAQALNAQGSLQLTKGNPAEALRSWQRSAALYDEIGDAQGRLGSQINQVQALQRLGLYRQARTRLEEINQQLQSQPNSVLKSKALQSLGVTLQHMGVFEDSLDALQQSLTISQQLGMGGDTSAVLLNLGHAWRRLSNIPKALDFYQQSAATATTAIAKVNAQLSQLNLLIETEQIPAVQGLLPQIQMQLPRLSASRGAVYAGVNVVQSLLTLTPEVRQDVLPNHGSAMVQILSEAILQARQLGDVRAESYAVGQLGQVYEQAGQWDHAQALTAQALALVHGISAPEITYQWQWQLGRILCQGEIPCALTGDGEGAIAAYTEAITQLGVLRTDLVATSQIQFSFRERVEPVYRELVTLLLTPSPNQAEISQANLKQARNVIEALQLAELDNFFQSACLDVQAQQIDQIDRAAAVLYPIILSDRLAVILSIKDQPLHYYATALSNTEIQNSLSQMRQSLSLAFPSQLRLQVSQKLYDWMIRPADRYLAAQDIQTLVLVPDGSLRSFPISALHDGEQYLIEKYSIAINSGLKLLEPQSLEPEQFNLLIGGLTEPRQGFAALPAASFEMEQIRAKVPAQLFLNQDFTQANLQTQLNHAKSSIVHLITHGQFSSTQDDTFILAWDRKIKADDLSNMLQTRQLKVNSPLDLLVLSACQTASGDNQAGLGLAGLALRSGARSTLASLWSVDDQSTAQLMVKFYDMLNQPETTKAEALRQAQIALLGQDGYQHPFFWAAFVMVGNWL
ncbi:CHAT domain-containing protein [Leptothoe sp. PORK10 BA2]|uniref:CHAT domain-containing protein n=1 Tax=Leptothoe sp. PORK10 BA2 TaxID=3110254 RepID=UPI002B209ACE|nr:CHAT domain-containing protein [Leptothoe sp. PORK10 BA2]MEA5464365.1 CHAT domain-containing protein [Leptothoe sp. PORK10 BA2]